MTPCSAHDVLIVVASFGSRYESLIAPDIWRRSRPVGGPTPNVLTVLDDVSHA
jgi:hypothetical protein